MIFREKWQEISCNTQQRVEQVGYLSAHARTSYVNTRNACVQKGAENLKQY